MKVRLIITKTIHNYIVGHASGKKSFEYWLNKVECADWKIPEDILETFGSADLLGKGSNRVVFNVGGNNYRMVCKYHFGFNRVHLFVCWIGTHDEYGILCYRNGHYRVNTY